MELSEKYAVKPYEISNEEKFDEFKRVMITMPSTNNVRILL
jgi:hypothetical protein